MVMKKNFSSDKIVIIGSNNEKNLFPVGYKFLVNDMLHTIIKSFKEDNTEMRESRDGSGKIEITTVNTLKRDLIDGSIIPFVESIKKKKDSNDKEN